MGDPAAKALAWWRHSVCPGPHVSAAGCGACGWDGSHETRVVQGPYVATARGVCGCGWAGDIRTGHDARWQAGADSDDHHNDSRPD